MLHLSSQPDRIGIQSNWGFRVDYTMFAIHIALLPDRSGVKTGARVLEVLRVDRHIAPLGQKIEDKPFN